MTDGRSMDTGSTSTVMMHGDFGNIVTAFLAIVVFAGVSQGSEGHGLFKPADDLWINDPRVVVVDGVYHLFYQKPPRVIGRAVSKDLLSWHYKPGGITAGPKGSWDDKDICTSGFLYWQGTFYSLYTGRSDAHGERGRYQRIGLATSRDGFRFERHPDNPVLLSDPNWYEDDYTNAPGYHNVAWRDPDVWRDPESGFFYAYLTGRINKGPGNRRGCIALARSQDWVLWHCLPPCYAPGREPYHEVPQMLPWRDGKTYVLFFGSKRGGFTQMKYVFGTDPLRFDGSEPGRHLLGSQVNRSGRGMEYSSWVIPHRGGYELVHMVYEWKGGKLVRGRMALPKGLAGTPQTGLQVRLRGDLAPRREDALDIGSIRLGDGWRRDGEDLVGQAGNERIAFDLPGSGPRVLSMDAAVASGAALGVMLGSSGREPAIRMTLNGGGVIRAETPGVETRQRWEVRSAARVNLAFAVVGKYVEVYADGRYLGVACSVEGPASGALTVFAEGQGTCRVRSLAQRRIDLTHTYARYAAFRKG